MRVGIRSVENHKEGKYQVTVDLQGIWERFESMMDAQKWLDLMRKTGADEPFNISLREVVIMPRKELVYESSYVY